jgi:tetratricopeptide (TPR) repeat protein
MLLDGRSFIDMACDKNGAVIGQATGSGALLVRPGQRTSFLGPHGGAQHVAISPDGTYAATGINAGEEGVKIWDTKTRRLVVHFPMGKLCGGLFSPDGRWLALQGTAGCQVVKVGSWERTFADHWDDAAFSPDGALLAAVSKQGLIRLLEPATGRELAQLEDPIQSRGWPVFTPDGTRLIISSDSEQTIHVWDLRAIRAQLAQMGLDWDAARYPEVEHSAPLPLQVTVELGTAFVDPRATVGLCSFRLAFNPFDFEAYLQRGRACGRLKEPKQALTDYSTALTLMPAEHPSRGEALFRRSNNYRALGDEVQADADLHQFAERDLSLPEELRAVGAQQCNNLAWRYVTGPEKQRDPKKALPLAQKAVTLDADGWECLNTLGVAYYRLGQYLQAVDTLEHSLQESQGETAAFDLFFLAMCHHQLGETKKAQEEYQRAVRWFEEHRAKLASPNWMSELTAFQVEAETLLKQPPPRRPEGGP